MDLQKADAAVNMLLPKTAQFWVNASEVIHFAVKKAEAPKRLVGPGDKLRWRKFIIHIPHGIGLARHFLKQLTYDVFFIAKMEVKVPGTNRQMFSNMICSYRDRTTLVKKIDTGIQNSLAVSSHCHLPVNVK